MSETVNIEKELNLERENFDFRRSRLQKMNESNES